MQRHRDGELDDLVRNTIIWIAVVLWLGWGYFVQEPPGDAYTDTVRDAFTIVLAIVIPLISLVVVLAWWSALRNRQKS
jgi:heme/copper-type cytochrome/quinol oxidase subunit 2